MCCGNLLGSSWVHNKLHAMCGGIISAVFRLNGLHELRRRLLWVWLPNITDDHSAENHLFTVVYGTDVSESEYME
jgi:hypothetical protein